MGQSFLDLCDGVATENDDAGKSMQPSGDLHVFYSRRREESDW